MQKMQKEVIPFVPRCRECLVFLPYEGAPHPEREACSLHLGSVPSDPVEWTVYSLYAAYPTLFGRSPWSRWFIFGHLFFAIGTEFEWIKGEMRDIFEKEFHVGEAVVWRSLEEEEAEYLEKITPPRGRDTPHMRALMEESKQHALAMLREDWAQFEKKPRKWYPLSESSPIFSLPEAVSTSWLLASIDATQMFLQGEIQGQSFHKIYKLIEWRAQLFARIGLAVPSLEENRMTSNLLREKTANQSL